MKIIKIQPNQTLEGVLPYPYFIYADGRVGVQKYWKGNPLSLLGFAVKPITGEMKIFLKDFIFDPDSAVGLYPVFQTKEGKWFTSKDAIENVEKVRKVRIKKE